MMLSANWRSGLLSQQRARLPQFGKELLFECEFQVRRASRAAGSRTRADHALHQLNVPQSPTHDQFIKFSEAFAHIDPVAIAVFVAVEGKDRSCPGRESLLFRRTFIEE